MPNSPSRIDRRQFLQRATLAAGAAIRVPIALDGMGVFNMPDGRFRLVRNHEDRNSPGEGTTAVDLNAYDSQGGGGTTTLVVNPFTRELERDFISLNGTIVNCAGGVTPWQSWITCEETNAGTSSGWLRQHGYCFDVPAAADGPVPAVAVPSMGRFSHEAVAVDPLTWTPADARDRRPVPVRRAQQPDGGRRPAGDVGGHRQSESSGHVVHGRPAPDDGTLTLICESPNAAVLNFPDNLAVSPQNALLLCEDAPGFNQFLRGVTLDGRIFDFALNLETNQEWAGATFADADPAWNDRRIRGANRPLGGRWDRVTLFVNRQGPTNGPTPPAAGTEGMTFAIWGPWGNGAL